MSPRRATRAPSGAPERGTAAPSTATVPSLRAALAAVRTCLEARLGDSHAAAAAVDDGEGESSDGAPLAALVERFSLSPFERDVLLLCAGVELDATFAALVARAQRGRATHGPTFGLALAALPAAHWSAIAPTAALRRWRLVDLQPRAGVTGALLRIDERILHYLTGLAYLDPRVGGLVVPVDLPDALTPSQGRAASALAAAWAAGTTLERAPVVSLTGDRDAHEAVAATAAGALGLRLHRLAASDIPAVPSERLALARLWEREAMLLGSALLVVVDPDGGDEPRERARLLARDVAAVFALSGVERVELGARGCAQLHVPRPDASELALVWRTELGPRAAELNGAVARVASQFALDAPAIRRAARETLAASDGDLGDRLWRACRRQLRRGMDRLAQPIEARATWDDLVLPAPQMLLLRTIVAQVRQRARVSDEWGFAERGERGLGIHALFSGPSGTGKTMAAEVIANALALDLYRIDLGAVVSKWVGETEKNLERVFAAAERSGAILLFDEADALFGRRSEVRDSHDRYANLEVSFLLQRCESYRGLAILTSNLKAGIDHAFARRLRFTVTFPFPDEAHRREIWRRVFPARTPREGLDVDRLARLSLAGGHIRNVALNAAFLAADAGEPVRMRHLAAAARAEHAKLERPLGEAEVAGWS